MNADAETMSKPQMLLHLITGAFQRSNPIGEVVQQVSEMIAFYMNYTSNSKLNRFRQQMQVQQLYQMQNYVAEETIYYYRGTKMDRKF